MLRLLLLAIVVIGAISALCTYTAWLNGSFMRCPRCRRVGSWQRDTAEPVVEQTDEDGVVQWSRRTRICRHCGAQVVETWSDRGGRSFE